MSRPAETRIRLAELIAMISLGTDLGMGQPMEHVMRQSLIAMRLAERLGLDETTRAVVYYVGLISWVGCHIDAYELLLQPVVLRLLGPRAWWMPRWLDRLLPEVGLSHDMPEAERTPASPVKRRTACRGAAIETLASSPRRPAARP